jgi:hypothetical protein
VSYFTHASEKRRYQYNNREAAWDGERRRSLRHPNPGIPLWRMVMGWESPARDLVDEIPEAPPACAGGGPSGYIFTYGINEGQHIFYQGRLGDGSGDGHIHELYTDNLLKWHHHDLTDAAGAPLAVSYTSPSAYAFELQASQHVIYTGRLGDESGAKHIYELWWNIREGKWHHHDLIAASHPPAPLAVSNPFGYEFSPNEFTGHQCVVYTGTDGHIHELRWDGGDGKWHHFDLNERAQVGMLAVTQPTAYVFKSLVQRHVLYVGTDDHIHELYWEPSVGDWHYGGDLTAATGAQLPREEVTGFAFDAEGTQFVHYRGPDGHIHQLSWDGNAGWHPDFDLTANIGGPLGAGPPTGYVFPFENTLHVVYTGQDRHIHEFWRDSSGWHPNDLTIATRAQEALGPPVGYVSKNEQHVVFISYGYGITVLRWVPG